MATAVTNNLSSAGGAASSFTIAPALPDGLAFDAATGSISGTPVAITPEQSYTITAVNEFGSATVDLLLRVTDAAPAVTYPSTLIEVTGGVEMATVMPSSTGGAATGFMIDPPLPTGLTLDADTGEIRGTATQVDGWSVGKNPRGDTIYTDSSSGRVFRSKPEVARFLNVGQA